MTTTLLWREQPERTFYNWLHGTFRHARGALWRLPQAWNALCLQTAACGRHVVDASSEDVRRFVRGLETSGRPSAAEAQRRRLIEVLHLAYESVRGHGLRADNPVAPLLAEVPPVARPLPILLEDDQRSALVQALHGTTGDWRDERDRAIALLVMTEGWRPAEVAALCQSDLVQSEGRIALLRDGVRGRRLMRLNRHSQRAIASWLRVRAELRTEGDFRIEGDLVFPNDRGERFVPAELYRLVRHFLRRAGIESRHLGHLDIRDCVSLRAARRAGLARRSAGEGVHAPS